MIRRLIILLLIVGCDNSTESEQCDPKMLAEDLCNCPSPDNMDAIVIDDCGVCRLIDCCEVGSDNCLLEEDYNSETDMWIMSNGKYLISNYCRSIGPVQSDPYGASWKWVINGPDWNTTCTLP